jgi:hypothetical protein
MSACQSLNCDSFNPTFCPAASTDVQYSDTDSAVFLPVLCHDRFESRSLLTC